MAKTSLLRQAPDWDERLRAIEDALADVTRRLSRLEAPQPLVDSDAAGDTGASHTVTSAAAVAGVVVATMPAVTVRAVAGMVHREPPG